jgi:hypothetical protein
MNKEAQFLDGHWQMVSESTALCVKPESCKQTGYTGCMEGQHASVSFADAYLKGVNKFDAETAYKGSMF